MAAVNAAAVPTGPPYSIATIAEEITERVGGDPHFTDWPGVRRLRGLVLELHAFLLAALGGVTGDLGAQLGAALVGLDVTTDDLERIEEHITESLDDLEVAASVVERVMVHVVLARTVLIAAT